MSCIAALRRWNVSPCGQAMADAGVRRASGLPTHGPMCHETCQWHSATPLHEAAEKTEMRSVAVALPQGIYQITRTYARSACS